MLALRIDTSPKIFVEVYELVCINDKNTYSVVNTAVIINTTINTVGL